MPLGLLIKKRLGPRMMLGLSKYVFGFPREMFGFNRKVFGCPREVLEWPGDMLGCSQGGVCVPQGNAQGGVRMRGADA